MVAHCFLLFLFIATRYASAHTLLERDPSTWRDRRSKIGIVGAGTHGVYMAYRLCFEYSLCDITIYEAGPEASQSAWTLIDVIPGVENDRYRDGGTVQIPASVFSIIDDSPTNYELDTSLYEPFATLVDRYNLTLVPVLPQDLQFYDLTNGSPADPLAFLFLFMQQNNFTAEDLVKEAIQMLLFTEQFLRARKDGELKGPSDFYRLGFMKLGETLNDYFSRMDLPVMGHLYAATADLFGSIGPTFFGSPGNVMNYLINWRTPTLATILAQAGLKSDSVQLANFPFIVEVMRWLERGNPQTYVIAEGFQALYDGMVSDLSKAQVDFKFNSPVTSVSRKGGKFIVEHLNGHSSTSSMTPSSKSERQEVDIDRQDILFLACRKDCALNVLDEKYFPQQRRLYEGTTVAYLTNAFYAIDPLHIDAFEKITVNGTAFTYPAAFFAGTKDYEAEVADKCLNFFFYIQRANNILGIQGVTLDPERNFCTDRFPSQISYFLNIDNTNNNALIDSRFFPIGARPTVAAEADGWYNLLDSVDGADGLFLIGETFSGLTIPSSLLWLDDRFD